MEYRDELGRRRNCHFCTTGTRRVSCSALRDFYNRENSEKNLCGECPFFKTEAEFWAGWRKRR